MKKLLLATVLVLSSPMIASAEITTCGQDHLVRDTITDKIVACIPKAEWDKEQARVMASRNDDQNYMSVARGQSVNTVYGYVDTCPAWFPFGCTVLKSLVR